MRSTDRLRVAVVGKREEAQDVCSFELAGIGSQPLPSFSAGAHIDVHLGNGLCRQYSLCNSPGETHRYVIGVLREPASRGGSKCMHEGVREGDTLEISRPRNQFPLAERAPRSVLLAGGIGITPILAMAEQLARGGADFALHYCGRSRARMAFLGRIAASPFAARVRIHVDDEPATQLDLKGVLERAGEGAHVYVCGPTGFIQAVTHQALVVGIPQQRIHLEHFKATADAAVVGAFSLVLARSARTIEVPADKSALQSLLDNGVEIEASCEQGICGTCITTVLEGQPDHHDSYLTDSQRAANDVFLPCCSRARGGRLVIDL
jgi:vanillate monooxygenase ferredoxin subunit